MAKKSDYVVLRLHEEDLKRMGIKVKSSQMFEETTAIILTVKELQRPLERFHDSDFIDPWHHPFLSICDHKLLEAVGKWQRLADERENAHGDVVDAKFKMEEELIEVKDKLEKEEAAHLSRCKAYNDVCEDLESAENQLRLKETALGAKDATIAELQKQNKDYDTRLGMYERRFEIVPDHFRKLTRWQQFWASFFNISYKRPDAKKKRKPQTQREKT